ncbi:MULTISPECIES: hypothetical protein [Pseudofrankia]|uniref:hypothetical protein n=1 Tax=Pseudofrankia TaxID=2994363 RepID=UPI000234C79B|nr:MULTISPECIES: hypothetical protein [Pseudofrankia]OHV29152.1 hypothetical protein BCD49_36330 [Pseudofrankia sp. EUN1h]
MLGTFWEAVGGKLADRAAAISIPALIFWLGGLAAWTYHHGGLHSLTTHTNWLDRQTTLVQATAVLTVLLAVAASAVLIHQAATPLLRLLEGYWPAWADPLRHRLAHWLATRAAHDQKAWQTAYAQIHPPATPTVDQLAAYTRLERRRRRRPSPATPGYFLPTPIGNILRAAERRPLDKYGLDTVICWPRLWPALPDNVRADLQAARTALDTAATTTLWGLLFCAFAPLTLLAIPIGLAVAALTITLVIPARAGIFGDLIEAAYDTHRTTLYTQLRWPPPTNPHQEHEHGRKLTTYLWRGSDDTTPTFTPPS